MIHWELCRQFKFNHTNKWYMHNPKSLLENETQELLRDFEIQTDHLISARRPHLIIIRTKENMQNCGLCCPGWPQDMTIICHNKPPDRKGGWTAVVVNWECGWRHARKRCAENLWILKRVELRSTVEDSVWVFRIWSDQIIFFEPQPADINWDLKHHKMCRALRGQHSMVSVCFYDLCLSPRVTKEWW